MGPLARRVAAAINRTEAVDGVPFASPVAMRPRVHERWFSWVHYGVMVPGLPEPHRFFGVMAILGTSGAACFDNDHLIATTPRDTAYVMSGTAADGGLAAYAMSADCALAADGSRLAFGPDDLRLEGRPPRVRLRAGGETSVALELDVTDKVAYFSRVPGIYDHWSLLARCRGTVGEVAVDTLCTYEYARGVGPYTVTRRVVPRWAKAPIRAFTYQVLNLSPRDQLLLTVAGPSWSRPWHEGAWERGLDDHGAVHHAVELHVEAHRRAPLVTPDGRVTRMPARWRWRVRDDGGAEVAVLRCEATDDWVYGLGAGHVGSFTYTGTVRGAEVAGRAYVEWIEL